MNLKTDKKKSPLKGVYVFYSVIIALCILALFVFNLNIYAKAVLCTLYIGISLRMYHAQSQKCHDSPS